MPDSINKKSKLQSVKASVRKGISSAGDAAPEKARSARDATVDGVKAVTESSLAQGLASAGAPPRRLPETSLLKAPKLQGTPLLGAGGSHGKV